jgi:glycosyltransferase involved in cell wall biosynthesis
VLGRLGRLEIAEIYKHSDIGVLINSSSNQHSYEFTSPLKYFEYMFAGLKVVGVDFPSHRVLPNSSEINFFEENSISSFENAVMTAAKKKKVDNLDIKDFSLDVRAKKILKLLS